VEGPKGEVQGTTGIPWRWMGSCRPNRRDHVTEAADQCPNRKKSSALCSE